jgi:hypothetical protein
MELADRRAYSTADTGHISHVRGEAMQVEDKLARYAESAFEQSSDFDLDDFGVASMDDLLHAMEESTRRVIVAVTTNKLADLELSLRQSLSKSAIESIR